MIEGLDMEKLQEFSAERGMEWKFTTPAAPHQNGCAEALVKSCKILVVLDITTQHAVVLPKLFSADDATF